MSATSSASRGSSRGSSRRGRLRLDPQVLVLGGGPAGSAAAGLLATWGLDVQLVERPPSPGAEARSLAESLPPSARKVLGATGLLHVVEAEEFHPNRGNTALWRGEARSDDFGGQATGFHVLRSRFDAVLLRSAAGAGAVVVRGTARAPGRTGDGWTVPVDLAGGRRIAVRPMWLLDCTGRTGLVARRWRTPERQAPTLAVVRCYRASNGWREVDPAHAVVESHGGGWAWSVPTSPTERHVAVMLDPQVQSPRPSGADREASSKAFADGIGRTSLLRSVAGAARAIGPPWAVTASMYTAREFASGRALLVGDAGSFVDPMSSYGVKKALASAWLAAVAVLTSIRDPQMEQTAVEFFRRRERDMYRALRDGMASHLAVPEPADAPFSDSDVGSSDSAGPNAAPSDFWHKRAAWLADAPDSGVATTSSPARLRSDPAVAAALQALRSGSGRVREGRLAVANRPRVSGNRIETAPMLVSERFPEGVGHLRGVDMLRLAELAPAADNPGALYESYSAWADRRGEPTPALADVVGALAVLVADGVLVLVDEGPGA